MGFAPCPICGYRLCACESQGEEREPDIELPWGQLRAVYWSICRLPLPALGVILKLFSLDTDDTWRNLFQLLTGPAQYGFGSHYRSSFTSWLPICWSWDAAF